MVQSPILKPFDTFLREEWHPGAVHITTPFEAHEQSTKFFVARTVQSMATVVQPRRPFCDSIESTALTDKGLPSSHAESHLGPRRFPQNPLRRSRASRPKRERQEKSIVPLAASPRAASTFQHNALSLSLETNRQRKAVASVTRSYPLTTYQTSKSGQSGNLLIVAVGTISKSPKTTFTSESTQLKPFHYPKHHPVVTHLPLSCLLFAQRRQSYAS